MHSGIDKTLEKLGQKSPNIDLLWTIDFHDRENHVIGQRLHGKLHGTIFYFENAKSEVPFKSATFRAGVLDGRTTFFSSSRDEDGGIILHLERDTHYRGGYPMKDTLYNKGLLFEETQYNVLGDNHGQFIRYHANQEIDYFGVYENGLKEGEWQFFRSDGTPLKTVTYQNDSRNGISQEMDSKGRVCLYEEYSDGQLNGNRTSAQFNDGDVVEKSTTYSNGIISGPYEERFNGVATVKGEFDNGKKTGEWKFYDDGQLILKSSFQNDALHGRSVEYKEGFKWEGEYSNGKKNGDWKRFPDSMRYSDQVYHYVQGISKYYLTYDSEGKLTEKGYLSNGQPHGVAIKIGKEGNEIAVINKNGVFDRVLSLQENNPQLSSLQNQNAIKL